MKHEALPRSTGLDARFDAELAAAIPGWVPASSIEGVRHRVAEHRFELGPGERPSVADYRLADGRMILTHTFVPPELRDKGVAERLVTAALEHARAEGLKVVPQCSYVETFLRRHPEFADLRAE